MLTSLSIGSKSFMPTSLSVRLSDCFSFLKKHRPITGNDRLKRLFKKTAKKQLWNFIKGTQKDKKFS